MSTWSATIYLSFADQATAQAELAAAGLTAADSLTPLDATFAALVPIVEWSTLPTPTNPGVQRPGFWIMARLDTSSAGYAAAMAALASYVQTLAHPDNVFA